MTIIKKSIKFDTRKTTKKKAMKHKKISETTVQDYSVIPCIWRLRS